MASKSNPNPLDEIVESIPGSYAEADNLVAAAGAAGMVPPGLVGGEIDQYMRASEIVARFLAEWQSPKLAYPVSQSDEEVGVGTMAAAYKKAMGCSDTLAIEETVRTITSWVHGVTASGALKRQQAKIVAASEAYDTTSVRLWVVEMPPSQLTKDGKTHAVIALWPTRTYTTPDRKTGEIRTFVDEGRCDPERTRGKKIPNQLKVWGGNGGIVRMLTKAEADKLALDWTWDSDEADRTATAISTCRTLERLSLRRDLAGPLPEREPVGDIDPYSSPF